MKNGYKGFIIFIAIWVIIAAMLNMILNKLNASNSVTNNNINNNEVSENTQKEKDFNSKFLSQGEMRGVWISTVNNLDWPNVGSYNNKKIQKELLKEKLDFVEKNNMNTVFFQVRPMGDALYKSNYSPWSRYLTGELGKDPGYDPLEFAIEEAHKRGIELQAWFNPFRIDSNSQNFDLTDYISKLLEESPLKKNLNWIVKYDKYTYLDIGIPEVREYVINLIIEVVDKYNIDGIILDDYFYPYPVEGVEFSDKSTYEKYGQEFNSKEDWRRNNVDNFIYELNKKIKEKNSNLKFGVSPFGIWRNGESIGGSNTRGLSSYEDIYVNSRKWIKEGYLDYIVPQIYWQFNNSNAPYTTLVDWWSNQVEGTNIQLYIGIAVYKINDSTYGQEWLKDDEVINQIIYSRNDKNVKGNCFFRLASLEENRLGFTDKLKSLYEKNK